MDDAPIEKEREFADRFFVERDVICDPSKREFILDGSEDEKGTEGCCRECGMYASVNDGSAAEGYLSYPADIPGRKAGDAGYLLSADLQAGLQGDGTDDAHRAGNN